MRRILDSKDRPRVGFVGMGWIGMNRFAALQQQNLVELLGVVEPDKDQREATRAKFEAVSFYRSIQQLLALKLDGVVIATPSALHAQHALQALDAGVSVFCQKPLANNVDDVSAIIETAQLQNRLLGVDFSYRELKASRLLRKMLRSGSIGKLFAVEGTFHNAYGPDKAWYYQPKQSGGGCLIDLGIHLVDLVLWANDFPSVQDVSSRLFSGGEELHTPPAKNEDFAVLNMRLAEGCEVHLQSSWNASAGCDAEIRLVFWGSQGALVLKNVAGSFYDFELKHCVGTSQTTLVEPPDDWGGRAICRWASQLASSPAFHPSAYRYFNSSEIIAKAYGVRGRISPESKAKFPHDQLTEIQRDGTYAERI
ncbi:MAG: Gfo/Idh/MocA family oxidoreductase [Bdellovibrionales bacterium]|nr:Gfo/Idh/MocA family oxidoreductase [Bdellovibrionales bacterium]